MRWGWFPASGYFLLQVGRVQFRLWPRGWVPWYLNRDWGTTWFGIGPFDMEIG